MGPVRLDTSAPVEGRNRPTDGAVHTSVWGNDLRGMRGKVFAGEAHVPVSRGDELAGGDVGPSAWRANK